MLENVSPVLDRTNVELETDYKAVKELYLSNRMDVRVVGKYFTLCNFHFNILDEKVNTKRMEELLHRRKVLRNIFIHDDQEGRIFYFARDLSDDEKFKEAVEDLF